MSNRVRVLHNQLLARANEGRVGHEAAIDIVQNDGLLFLRCIGRVDEVRLFLFQVHDHVNVPKSLVVRIDHDLVINRNLAIDFANGFMLMAGCCFHFLNWSAAIDSDGASKVPPLAVDGFLGEHGIGRKQHSGRQCDDGQF